MGVRAPEGAPQVHEGHPGGPPAAAIVGVGTLAFVLLVANGRAIPAGSLAGADYAGKALASLAAAGAVAVLFAAMGRAHAAAAARTSALVFGLGTTVWASSQSLGPQPFALFALSVALLFLLKAGDDPVWAGRAGLPLALGVAAWPASVAAALALGLGAVWRWPRATLRLVAWAAPAIALRLVAQPFLPARLTGLEGLGEALGTGHLGLLASPAKGLLVFAPVVVVAAIGMARAWGWGERWLVVTLGGAFLAEWALVGSSRNWHGSPGFGPVTLTAALPLLCLFLPEGLDRFPRLGACLAALSIGVQGVGAFASDGSWERLYEKPTRDAAFWSLERSPILYYLRRRVVILAMPELEAGRWRTREHRFVVGGPAGSRFTFEGDGVVVKGADATAGDVHLLGGARVSGGHAILESPGDGLFLRVRPVARLRALELRLVGQGNGTIAVGEGSFWSPPRLKEYSVAGSFRLRHRYLYAESGGADVTVELQRGRASLVSVGLVAPSDPENPLELPAR